MKEIESYFNAESAESILFIIVSLIALGISAYFLAKVRQPYYNGVAIGLTFVALIQLTVGVTIYLRSPKDIERVQSYVNADIQYDSLETEEIPRMERVMRNFAIYRWIEIVMVLFGIGVFLGIRQPIFWKGLGLGLAIQGTLMLALDFFAERRGAEYLEYLKTLI